MHRLQTLFVHRLVHQQAVSGVWVVAGIVAGTHRCDVKVFPRVLGRVCSLQDGHTVPEHSCAEEAGGVGVVVEHSRAFVVEYPVAPLASERDQLATRSRSHSPRERFLLLWRRTIFRSAERNEIVMQEFVHMWCQVAHDQHIRIQKQTTVARQQLPLHPVHTLAVGARVPDVFAQVRHIRVDVVASERENAELSSTVLANRLQTQVQMLRTLPLVRCELVVEPQGGTTVEGVVGGLGGGHFGLCWVIVCMGRWDIIVQLLAVFFLYSSIAVTTAVDSGSVRSSILLRDCSEFGRSFLMLSNNIRPLFE